MYKNQYYTHILRYLVSLNWVSKFFTMSSSSAYIRQYAPSNNSITIRCFEYNSLSLSHLVIEFWSADATTIISNIWSNPGIRTVTPSINPKTRATSVRNTFSERNWKKPQGRHKKKEKWKNCWCREVAKWMGKIPSWWCIPRRKATRMKCLPPCLH